MKRLNAGVLVVSALLAATVSGSASAVVIIQNLGGCQTTDVRNAGVEATSCQGLFTGSGGGQNVDLDKINAYFGDGFSLLGKSDQGGSGVTIDVGEGTWSAPNLADYGEFVVGLKQSTYWAGYYFDSVHGTGGTWSTSGWNIGQPAGGISHLDVYVRGTTAVPEPGSLALLAMGLLGLGAAARRKQKKAG